MSEDLTLQDALPPFSGASDADDHSRPSDFVLRSSDGVDFHVHRDILKFASDCFDGMFAIPGGDCDPNGLRRNGKPVLVLPESEAVLFQLLRLAYPADALAHYTLEQLDLDIFVAVYMGAQKYQFLRVERILKQMLDDSALIYKHPHRFFAFARLCDFPELSRKAALLTLRSPLSHDTPVFPEMKLLSWEDAHILYRFHQLCGQKAGQLAEQAAIPSSSSDEGARIWFWNDDSANIFAWWRYGHKGRCKDAARDAPVQWFKEHIARLAAQLRLCPSGATAKRKALSVSPADCVIMDTCSLCSERADADLARFAHLLAKEIDLSNSRLAEETF
ncbi:hypothetical protein K438DRAFT_1718755 [Mycena galopus ATCC 62051]|nr:hypothetical protein K438DRAFT_1718755 [Mycena galopus ATCC 62051]